MSTALTLTYNGTEVLFDRETGMGSLTAMYKACGSPENKHPARWLRSPQATEIIEALAQRLNVPVGTLVQTQHGGNTSGTWVHWQIATIYAHYLNPDFYLAWNEYARAYLEGKSLAPAIDNARLTDLETRVARLEGRRTLPAPRPGPIPERFAEIIAALQAQGGRARPHAIALALSLNVNTVQKRLIRMYISGLIQRVDYGVYQTTELCYTT